MRRVWCSVVVVVALALSASPVGAQQVPVERVDLASLLDAFPDGGNCTGVPDEIPGLFNFSEACAVHDVCYASGQPQLACDEVFRQQMVAACAVQYPSALDPRRSLCLILAQLYYFGVRLFGQFFL